MGNKPLFPMLSILLCLQGRRFTVLLMFNVTTTTRTYAYLTRCSVTSTSSELRVKRFPPLPHVPSVAVDWSSSQSKRSSCGWAAEASHEGTDAMSDPDSRWRWDRVLYRISLPRCCVRSWINIRRTHQATCWYMFLPSAAVAHCSPDTDNGCSQDSSPCFYNQSCGLL